MHGRSTATKAADLASGLGAIVLGAGLALVAPAAFRANAVPLLVAGLLVHGLGMTLKYRLEGREKAPLRWERVLFWLCWASLAVLGLWIVVDMASR